MTPRTTVVSAAAATTHDKTTIVPDVRTLAPGPSAPTAIGFTFPQAALQRHECSYYGIRDGDYRRRLYPPHTKRSLLPSNRYRLKSPRAARQPDKDGSVFGANDQTVRCTSSVTIVQPRTTEKEASFICLREASASATVL